MRNLSATCFSASKSRLDVYKRQDKMLHLGDIFHMYHKEDVPVNLNQNSLASHVFVTGSTGSGKRDVYKRQYQRQDF